MRPIALILSGAFIDQELAAELGALPPAFLPVGTGRLFELQVGALRPLHPEIFLTLPEAFRVEETDGRRLEVLGVRVLPSPEGLSLAEAALHALAHIGFQDRPLRLLHGDTLVLDENLAAEDVVSVAQGRDGYRWARVRARDDRVVEIAPPDPAAPEAPDLILTGSFAFASARAFAEALAQARGDFIAALNIYAACHPLGLAADGRWLDFGHVQTFFRSRRVISTARAFNSLTITEAVVRKRSDDARKLRAEAFWLSATPPAIRPYCARVVDEGEDEHGGYYVTDYEYLPTLAEIHAFGRLNRASWTDILEGCASFMDLAAKELHAPHEDALSQLLVRKTADRLETFSAATGFDLDAPLRVNGRACPSVRACADVVETILAAAPRRPALMHGDFCFSNILYNFRMRRIRLIDPRGSVGDGPPSLFGDSLYDAAKLMHSIDGGYDLIVSGRHRGSQALSGDLEIAFGEEEDHAWLRAEARARVMGGVDLGADAVRAAVVALFLSMLPLHHERPDRQSAFLANALRLFRALDGGAAP